MAPFGTLRENVALRLPAMVSVLLHYFCALCYLLCFYYKQSFLS
jgi:hypothetical protein